MSVTPRTFASLPMEAWLPSEPRLVKTIEFNCWMRSQATQLARSKGTLGNHGVFGLPPMASGFSLPDGTRSFVVGMSKNESKFESKMRRGQVPFVQ